MHLQNWSVEIFWMTQESKIFKILTVILKEVSYQGFMIIVGQLVINDPVPIISMCIISIMKCYFAR